MVVLLRMAPFLERKFNLVELGPRSTGKVQRVVNILKGYMASNQSGRRARYLSGSHKCQ
jgi:predicted ATP-dependent Lon-type protease